MRFEVPQFIEVEDKIFGPFTWKQFIYLAGGAGIALITYFTLPLFLFVLIGIPLSALAGFLAFHKVNNRPFSIFLESIFHYVSNKKLYLWKKTNQQTVSPQTPIIAPTPTKVTASTSKDNLTALSRRLSLETLEPDVTVDKNI
ncbi:PrgI family protein [bacterium]|nr:PrgI family protein [bacterium]